MNNETRDAPVNEVRRDGVGIPQVVADTVEELAWLQGRTVAQDRTWQVEHSRLRAEGRTAALLGEQGLPWDRMVRRVGIEALGRRAYDGLQPATRSEERRVGKECRSRWSPYH